MADNDSARNDFATKYVKSATILGTAAVAAAMIATPYAYAIDVPVDEAANARTVSAVLYGPAEPTSPSSWANITALYGPERPITQLEIIERCPVVLLVDDFIAKGIAGGVAAGAMAVEKQRNKKKTADEQQED